MKFNQVNIHKFTPMENAVKEIIELVGMIEPEISHNDNSNAVVWGMDTDCGLLEDIIKTGLLILKKYGIDSSTKELH